MRSVDEVVTVDEIMSTPAEYDHALEVRSVGPAIVLILERDAPLRMEALASTEAEEDALRETARNDARWWHILDAWFAARADEGDTWFRREIRHGERLSSGQRLSTLRVGSTR
jgi:hypothetical protein